MAQVTYRLMYLSIYNPSFLQSQNCMDQYAEIIGKNASTEDYHKIAAHFENCGDHYKAGKFFFACELYDQVGSFTCSVAPQLY